MSDKNPALLMMQLRMLEMKLDSGMKIILEENGSKEQIDEFQDSLRQEFKELFKED